MNNIHLLALIPIIITVAYNVSTVNTSSFPIRQVGGPVTTHWYLKEISSGCFQKEPVVEIKNNEIRVVISNEKKTFFMASEKIEDIDIKDGKVIIHSIKEKTKSGARLTPIHILTHYQDEGTKLIGVKAFREISGERFDLERDEQFYHCSSPTLWGRFQLGLGFKEMFNPNYKNGIYIDD